jgi:predicted nucleic acid-binding protein
MIEDDEPFALTGIVVAEVLQGLTRGSASIEHYLAQWDMLEPRGFETYREAARIYRAGRGKGIALTTIDTLIAAIALEHGTSVFTLDQDFSRIARYHAFAASQILILSVKYLVLTCLPPQRSRLAGLGLAFV